jgi:hypothetical protein
MYIYMYITYIPVTEMTAEVPAAASDLRTSMIHWTCCVKYRINDINPYAFIHLRLKLCMFEYVCAFISIYVYI